VLPAGSAFFDAKKGITAFSIPISAYKIEVMLNIQKSVFALCQDLYYDLIVHNSKNNKDKFMHLNEFFINGHL